MPRRTHPFDDFLRDLKLAVRMLRKTPAFTVVALLTLALAVGGNTAIFSLINAVLLRPLNVPRADRLVVLRIQPAEYGYAWSAPLFRYLEDHTQQVFSDVFAFTGHPFQARGASGTEKIPGALVSGQYFRGLQVSPQAGRVLTPADDVAGGGSNGPVAVISDRFWKRWFQADRQAIGRKIVLDNVSFTIVGILPPGAAHPEIGHRPDVIASIAIEPLVDAPYNNTAGGYHSWWMSADARLRDGISRTQANAYLRSQAQPILNAVIPDPNWSFEKSKRSQIYFTAEPGASGFSYLRLRFRKPLVAVMALVTIVLLIACLNLASLLMARAAAREREIATRFALGASRARLLRQLLTETLLLASVGTLLGFGAAPLFGRALLAFVTTQNSDARFDVTPDGRVLAFTALVAALATILTGLAPALRSTGRALQQRMREASANLRGGERRHIWPRVLLGGEVGLALMLTAGAGLLGYSLVQLREIPLGFEPRGLTLMDLDVGKQQRDGAELSRLYRDIADEINRIPGVTAASFAMLTPISQSDWTSDVSAPGQPAHEVFRNRVGPDYFKAMRTRLIAGREFRWTDTDASGHVAILNEEAAKLLFPGQNPMGQRVFEDKQSAEVVGVVANSKYFEIREAMVPTVYSSMTQDFKNKPSFTLLVRTNGPPAPAIAAARATILRLTPEVPAPPPANMEIQIADSLSTERMMATLALFFALVALLITGVGLYGTLAYTTERRTGEIGIRMALGAQRRHVLSLVCMENVGIAIAGCLAGVIASVIMARWIASFLYGTSPRNPAILAAAALLLVAIASAASFIPAVRAARIDPMRAIRYE